MAPQSKSKPVPLRRLAPLELFSSSRHYRGNYRAVTVTSRYVLSPKLQSQLNLPSSGGSSSTDGTSSSSRDDAALAPLYRALGSLVTRHPLLQVGIIDEHCNEAAFVYVPEVDLRRHIEFVTLEVKEAMNGHAPGGDDAKAGGKGYDEMLTEFLAEQHDRLWEELATLPPWRIIVVTGSNQHQAKQDGTPARQSIDIIFSFHHSLMDGTAGREFHQDLLSALNTPQSDNNTTKPAAPHHLLSFPSPPSLPEPQDKIIGFTLSASFWLRTIWGEFGPSLLKAAKPRLWSGNPVDYTIPHKTTLRTQFLPPDVLEELVEACRRHGTSLTGLYHGMIVASLARRIPVDEKAAGEERKEKKEKSNNKGFGFVCGTPVSLRPWILPSADPSLRDSLRVVLTEMEHHFSASDIAPFRPSPNASGSDSENQNKIQDDLIWSLAARTKQQIATRVATLPVDDIISMLRYVTNWQTWWDKKTGKQRGQTSSLSNIGILKPSNNPSLLPSPGKKQQDTKDGEEAGVKDGEVGGDQTYVTHMLFCGGPMMGGAPVGVNLGSAQGGYLGVSMSWAKSLADEEILRGVWADLTEMPLRWIEKGTFF